MTYVYQHYPLWIERSDGTRLIVDDAEHEARVRDADKHAPAETPPPYAAAMADGVDASVHQPETVRRPRGRPRLERKP